MNRLPLGPEPSGLPMTYTPFLKCPWQELNLHLTLRTGLLYPFKLQGRALYFTLFDSQRVEIGGVAVGAKICQYQNFAGI